MKFTRHAPSLEELLVMAKECNAIDQYRKEADVVWIRMGEEEYSIPLDSVFVFLETVIHYRRRAEPRSNTRPFPPKGCEGQLV